MVPIKDLATAISACRLLDLDYYDYYSEINSTPIKNPPPEELQKQLDRLGHLWLVFHSRRFGGDLEYSHNNHHTDKRGYQVIGFGFISFRLQINQGFLFYEIGALSESRSWSIVNEHYSYPWKKPDQWKWPVMTRAHRDLRKSLSRAASDLGDRLFLNNTAIKRLENSFNHLLSMNGFLSKRSKKPTLVCGDLSLVWFCAFGQSSRKHKNSTCFLSANVHSASLSHWYMRNGTPQFSADPLTYSDVSSSITEKIFASNFDRYVVDYIWPLVSLTCREFSEGELLRSFLRNIPQDIYVAQSKFFYLCSFGKSQEAEEGILDFFARALSDKEAVRDYLKFYSNNPPLPNQHHRRGSAHKDLAYLLTKGNFSRLIESINA